MFSIYLFRSIEQFGRIYTFDGRKFCALVQIYVILPYQLFVTFIKLFIHLYIYKQSIYILYVKLSFLQTRPLQSESDLTTQEEEDLQLAIALSLSIAEMDQQVCISQVIPSYMSCVVSTISGQ